MLLVLSSRNRYLALALGTDISGVAYWLIGSSRIAIAFIVCHLAGRAYGDQILALFVKYLGIDEPTIARLRAGFTKADWALIPVFVGSNIVAAISGIQRTAPTRLAALIALGLIARLALIQWLAHVFNEQLTDVINLVRNTVRFVGGSVILLVLLTNKEKITQVSRAITPFDTVSGITRSFPERLEQHAYLRECSSCGMTVNVNTAEPAMHP